MATVRHCPSTADAIEWTSARTHRRVRLHGGFGMARAHVSRGAAIASVLTLLATFFLLLGTQTARATNCSSGLAPALALTQTVTNGVGSVSYDLTVTNTGTCGATDVAVVVQLPAGATYLGFSGVQRSWSCALDATTNRVTCVLQSQLDQRSTQSSGASGTAEVVVNATGSTTGNKNNPPNVTESAFVTDAPQMPAGPVDGDDIVWGAGINPKTGGTITIDVTPNIEPNISHTVTVPSGTSGVVGLSEHALDPSCVTGVVPSCNSDLLVNAPTIGNGYSTIVMKFLGTTQPPPPAYDEGAGVQLMLACKGQTATPPCVYSIRGFNLNSPTAAYYLVTIRDSGGTHMWG
jgi:uncharacterized repeat protein (TIGR01451 family)